LRIEANRQNPPLTLLGVVEVTQDEFEFFMFAVKMNVLINIGVLVTLASLLVIAHFQNKRLRLLETRMYCIESRSGAGRYDPRRLPTITLEDEVPF
jgi:hypothetical protein